MRRRNDSISAYDISNGYICIRRPLVDRRLESCVTVYDLIEWEFILTRHETYFLTKRGIYWLKLVRRTALVRELTLITFFKQLSSLTSECV